MYKTNGIKIFIFILCATVVVIIEFFRRRKRRRLSNEALELGHEEYLKYLKKKYNELKTDFNNATADKDRDKIHREMNDVEQKIIFIEEELESQNK